MTQVSSRNAVTVGRVLMHLLPAVLLFALFAADITYVVDPSNQPTHNCFARNNYETLKSLTQPPPTESNKCN